MAWRFNSLTPGLLGERGRSLCLTSQFWSLWWNEIPSTNFPQRVHRKNFFNEWLRFERPKAKLLFLQRLNSLKRRLRTLSSEKTGSFERVEPFLLALQRLGQFETVWKCRLTFKMAAEDAARFEILQIQARMHDQLSKGERPSLERIFAKSHAILENSEISAASKISLATRAVVAAYRYGTRDDQPRADLIGSRIVELAKVYVPGSFEETVRLSVCYRGLSMMRSLSAEARKEMIDRVIELNASLQPQSQIEQIVAKENCLTALQTETKYALSLGDLSRAENCLKKIISIDPHDSVGQSEYALFLYRHERFREAVAHFERATKLGPPALGMNFYFLSKALLKCGEKRRSAAALRQAEIHDPRAISPKLERFARLAKATTRRALASEILKNRVLRKQLKDDEFSLLRSAC